LIICYRIGTNAHPMKTTSFPSPAGAALKLRCECTLLGEERATLARHEEELLRLVQLCDEEGATRGALAELRSAVAAAGEALKAALAPVLFARLEEEVGRALAPFYLQYGDAARAYHGTDAAGALVHALAPEPAASARELPGQAEEVLRWVRAALAGQVEWEFEGAEAR
jgi:hypothetical protein